MNKSYNNLWNFINKRFKNKSPSLDSLFVDNKNITDEKAIADSFNSYFANITKSFSVSKNMQSYLNSVHYKNLIKFTSSKLNNSIDFNIPHITEKSVKDILLKITKSNSIGLDSIPPKFIKYVLDPVAPIIAKIINIYIDNSYFPSSWKNAKVIPLHKTGPNNLLNNFRPISILPCLSKIYERHIADNLQDYLLCNNLLVPNQSGFRPLHSCETALLNLINFYQKCIDSDNMICCILLDFRKAFDIIDHDILLTKLKAYNINGKSYELFKSYLSFRKQSTHFKDTYSSFEDIMSGVPQRQHFRPYSILHLY